MNCVLMVYLFLFFSWYLYLITVRQYFCQYYKITTCAFCPLHFVKGLTAHFFALNFSLHNVFFCFGLSVLFCECCYIVVIKYYFVIYTITDCMNNIIIFFLCVCDLILFWFFSILNCVFIWCCFCSLYNDYVKSTQKIHRWGKTYGVFSSTPSIEYCDWWWSACVRAYLSTVWMIFFMFLYYFLINCLENLKAMFECFGYIFCIFVD